jgi:hypothetical protein
MAMYGKKGNVAVTRCDWSHVHGHGCSWEMDMASGRERGLVGGKP